MLSNREAVGVVPGGQKGTWRDSGEQSVATWAQSVATLALMVLRVMRPTSAHVIGGNDKDVATKHIIGGNQTSDSCRDDNRQHTAVHTRRTTTPRRSTLARVR